MARSGKSKKRGPVTSKSVKCDGINFASGLERYMYLCLKQAGIKAEYEGKTFTVHNDFEFPNRCYEHQANGKGGFKNRGSRKIRAITYTPDFIGEDFVIECKGRPNESFPLRWKLFKHYMALYHPRELIFMPKNQQDCKDVIRIIKEHRDGS